MGRFRRALHALFSPRAWLQRLLIANFFGYDTLEQAAIHKGPSVRLSPTVSVRNGARIKIGEGAEIGQFGNLWAGDTHGEINIGRFALLAPNVFVTASNYRFDEDSGPVMHCGSTEKTVTIGDNTWIGTGVVVVAGAEIGPGAIVAAGSVVSGRIPAMSVAAGIPARVVRLRGEPSTPIEDQHGGQ